MANKQETSKKVLNGLNSVISAIDFYKSDDGNVSLYLSDNARINMMNFIVDLFEKLKGPEWFTKAISKFISVSLPTIEYSLKGIILAYVESMLSCSIKPIITEQMIRDGVYFDLQNIDLMNILNHQPAIGSFASDKEKPDGKYLYFSCDEEHGIYTIPDLVHCEDMNAVLWYVKNNPGVRVVWNSVNNLDVIPNLVQLPSISLYITTQTVTTDSGVTITLNRLCKKTGVDENGNDVFTTLTNKRVSPENGFGYVEPYHSPDFAKQNKSNGIITLEYNNRSSQLTDAEKLPMTISEPIQNCLHVFIGCCSEVSPEKLTIQDNIHLQNEKVQKFENLKNSAKKLLQIIEKNKKKLENHDETPDIEMDTVFSSDFSKLNRFLTKLDSEPDVPIQALINDTFSSGNIQTLPTNDVNIVFQSLQDEFNNKIEISADLLNQSKNQLTSDMRDLTRLYNSQPPGIYPSTVSNYYYLHPLLEFNTDLIFSMKWFDEKVLTAQLINAITGCLEFSDLDLSANGLISLNMSPQAKIIEAELNALIEKVIETDDEIVNDCFFSFDNDKFNQMLQASEMKRMGINTNDGINHIGVVTAEELLNSINELPSNATKEEISTAIEHTLFKAVSCCGCKSIGSEEYGIDFNVNAIAGVELNRNSNIIETLIKKLTYVIVSTFLTPKIYMILMFNLKLIGQSESPFNLLEYISYCKVMFLDIINSVKEMIFTYLKDLIMEEINKLLQLYKPLLLQEQYNYYKNLILSCVSCINIHGNEYDWTPDGVRYADITEIIQSTNDEC